jgi:hypothetical protein
MDPIQPIGPRPPWIAELAAEQTLSLSRERRKQAGGDEKRRPRQRPRKPDGPDEDTPDGRHIDVRA